MIEELKNTFLFEMTAESLFFNIMSLISGQYMFVHLLHQLSNNASSSIVIQRHVREESSSV